MNYDEALNIFKKITEEKTGCDIRIWVGLDGIFKDNDYPDNNDELICYCGISHILDSGDWVVTAWFYMEDCVAIFKTPSSARQMAYFWMKWMGYLYGDGLTEPRFETNWLNIKSNRSIIEMIYSQEGEIIKNELLKKEEGN